jgi:hypothetical protein
MPHCVRVEPDAYSEQLSVPNGGFGKFHSKRLPLMVTQLRLCGAVAVDAGGAKVRSAQGEDIAPPATAAAMIKQPAIH